MIVESAIDLNLGDGTEADADADERKAEQVPFKPRGGVLNALTVVESGLDEHAAGADCLGILSDKRPLLRERQNRLQHERSQSEKDRSHQNCRLLSTSTVTGPSLTSSTCIIAWNSPVATTRPLERNSLTTASYVALATSGGAASS